MTKPHSDPTASASAVSGQGEAGNPRRLSQPEFVAVIAMCFASVAVAVDGMLPAMPQIAQALSPEAPNRVPLIIMAFVLGMGIGTLFVGPLSDAFGRKRVIALGALVFCVAAFWASRTQDLTMLLAARLVMGLGAAAPRVVSLALLRDLYAGREMARMTSFVMMVFTLVPAIAPLMGSMVLAVADWRAIFLAFILFSALANGWLMLRQPETLPPERRIPIRRKPLTQSFRAVIAHPVVIRAMIVLVCLFAALFATLGSIQQIFALTFGRAESFPVWFALIAIVGGTSSLLNAMLVVRLGMRRMVSTMLQVQVALSSVMAILSLGGLWPEAIHFPAALVWLASMFFMIGITVGNVNAIALEPMGRMAGMAASVTSAISTVGGAVLAAPIAMAFDGTPGPLAAGSALLCAVALAIMLRLDRGVAG